MKAARTPREPSGPASGSGSRPGDDSHTAVADGAGGSPDSQAALHESERRYRDLFNSIRDAILVADTDRRIIECNPAFTDLFGYRLQEIRGLPTNVVYEDLEEFQEMGKKIRGGMHGRGFVHTVRYRTRSGRVFPGETTVFNLTTEEGDVRGFIGQIRDVSESHETEEALRESEERHRALYENAPLPYQSLDGRGVILDVNPQWLATLGYEREEVLGRSFTDFLDPESAERFPFCFDRLLQDGAVDDLQYRMVAKDGRSIHVSFRGRVARTSDGGEERTYCTFHDITRREEAEGERNRLISAVEQFTDSVVITDPAGDIVYVNPAFTRVTGYCREEVLGKNPRILKSGVQDRDFYEGLWATITSGETWTGRMVNRRKDGSTFTEESVITPVRSPEGAITHFVAVKRDMTEHLRLQEERAEIEARYQQSQKLEAIGQLAGGVAHDLNNMLSPILGYAEILLHEPRDQADRMGAAREILEAGERARDLVAQLLAFSRRQPLEVRVVDLNTVVREFGSFLRRTIREDVRVEYDLASEPLLLRADSRQLEQVVLNLSVNAQDALPGGGNITVRTRATVLDEAQAAHHIGAEAGRYALLMVRDSGLGMDPDTRRRIFEPFFTTKEQGKGTGLGLATVYGIVRQHGGEISVQSVEGEGTTIACYFPLVEDAQACSEDPGDVVQNGHGDETIMVVEDESLVRRIAVRALRQRGFNVLQAANARECLQVLGEHSGPLHLLLTDVVLPGVNGKVLAREVRTLYPNVKTLFVSGYAGDVVTHRGVLEEGIEYLSKPFTPGVLRHKVRTLLDAAMEE